MKKIDRPDDDCKAWRDKWAEAKGWFGPWKLAERRRRVREKGHPLKLLDGGREVPPGRAA